MTYPESNLTQIIIINHYSSLAISNTYCLFLLGVIPGQIVFLHFIVATFYRDYHYVYASRLE